MREFSEQYLQLLKEDFSSLNLTRILDSEEFYSKQILDSIAPLLYSPLFKSEILKSKIIVDIGFGGGFPIIPLAKENPSVRFVGIEARAKKVKAVSEIADKLDIYNVSLIHERFENILFDVPCIITFKAVSQIPKLLKMINFTSNILICFYKGPNVEEQEDLSLISPDWNVSERVKYSISDDEKRELILIKPKNVPRGTSKKDKMVVKLSEIL